MNNRLFFKQKIIISEESQKKIFGSSNKIIVYGLLSCHYLEVAQALSKEYDPHDYYNYENEQLIPYHVRKNASEKVDAKCKAILTTLLCENYLRSKNNEPLIKLIFCVGFKNTDTNISLDINRILSSKLITNCELRRLYKVYSRIPQSLKTLFNLTYQFVNVIHNKGKSSESQDTYDLVSTSPFWEAPDFEKNWENRQKKKKPVQKPISWISELSKRTNGFTTLFYKEPHSEPVTSPTIKHEPVTSPTMKREPT